MEAAVVAAAAATAMRMTAAHRSACQKRAGEGGEKWWKSGGGRAWAGSTRGQEGGAMRVARGRGAAHTMEDDAGSARSFTTTGALREVVPPPCRQGESNPKPCPPYQADRAARPTAFFVPKIWKSQLRRR